MSAVPARPRIVLGGLVWALAVLQSIVVQVIAATAWAAPYSLRDNYISDLGNTGCGDFAVPGGPTAYVCSPDHLLMNVSFLASGVLTVAGVLLLRPLLGGRLGVAVAVLWILNGLGKILVGLAPENENLALHTLGAMNIPLGAVALLLAGLALRRRYPTFGRLSLALGVIGLVGFVLLLPAQRATTPFLGLGAGGTERVAEYPVSLWQLVVGALVAVVPRLRKPS